MPTASPLSLLSDRPKPPTVRRFVDATASHGADTAADIAACRAVLRKNSKTFFAASLLLPRAVREPASVLYGFCRLADDAVDVDGGRHDAVARLRERLDRAYRGTPLPVPADRALATVLATYGIPRAVPEALLEGLEWDAQGRRYETLNELYDYAARVAGTVGAMMAALMGARSPQALARACELGVAMQLSNIARDVGEDARMGRVYLPLQWLREASIDPDAFVAAPRFTSALGQVVQRLLQAADALYAQAGAGVAALPLACRPGINAARFLYAEIGREVERAGLDSVSQRAHVPGTRKARLLARAAATLAPNTSRLGAPPLPAIQGLVDATALTELTAKPSQSSSALAAPMTPPADRAIWVIDLFERLERRERAMRVTAPH